MDNLSLYFKESELEILKFNHEIDTNINLFTIESKTLDLEKNIYNVITESEYDIILENKLSEVGKGIGNFIDNIIKSIKELVKKCIDSIKLLFSSKSSESSSENKDEEKKIEETIKVINNPQTEEQKKIVEETKVEVIINNEDEILNEYIKELVKLEREVLNLKTQRYRLNTTLKQNSKTRNKKDDINDKIRYIEKSLDKLNQKYDDEFLKKNQKVITMSLKDAIRFNDDQLENVKLDFNAIQNNCEKVLKEFKKDADDNDIPVECKGLIKKLSNHLSTRARKSMVNILSGKKTASSTIKKKLIGLSVALLVGTINATVIMPRYLDAGEKVISKIQKMKNK